jgi:hypothetical protein
MFEHRSGLIAFRSMIATVCLAILAGCSIPKPVALSSVPAPTNVAANAGDTLVTLTWTASSGATSYNVKRSLSNGGPYGKIATPSSTTFSDSGVTNGNTYYYVVSALDTAGEGVDSAQTAATPFAPIAPPAAPANVVATSGNSQATLTWSASSGAASYRVKRSTTSGGPYTQVAAPTANSYVDVSLTNDTTYYYVVSALNSFGESANSAQVSALPVVSNPPPTTFGTWTNVTPSGVDLSSALCSNFGARTIQADPANPGNLYTGFDCQGIWKSTDYGVTWTGPINTGSNGALAGDCSGGITIAPGSTASVPTIYQACIRGNAVGFWRSVDGGVNWTQYVVAPGGVRQDYLPPVVDPYDNNHLLMTGHEFDSIVESVDGGATWTSVSLASGMLENVLNSTIFFVNTGASSTTRGTWLWSGAPVGGTYGTWRTANGGASWVQVDKNEGTSQIYQPDSTGLVFMAGNYSVLGAGVLRSKDYGQTWTHVGLTLGASVAFGTSKNVYSMAGAPVGAGNTFNPNFQVGAQPGTGTWVTPNVLGGLSQGPGQISVVNDGTHNVFVGAMWNAGLWRYVEP